MRHIAISILIILLTSSTFAYQSLQAVFDSAGANGTYNKYIELDSTVEYFGDLQIFDGLNVFIDGNGAIIHGDQTMIAISVFSSNLDIKNCVIVGGYGGIYLGNLSSGNVIANTVTGCEEAGIRTYYIDRFKSTKIWDNIVTDCDYGVFIVEDELPDYIGFNDLYNISEIPYAQFCPG